MKSLSKWSLNTFATLGFTLLYLPLLVTLLYSFNASETMIQMEGFSLRWYLSLGENQPLLGAIRNGLEIAITSSISVTLLALWAISSGRKGNWRRHSRKGLQGLSAAALIVPEIVTAVGLLMITSKGLRPLLRIWEIEDSSKILLIFAHHLYGLCYALLIINARERSFDPHLEEAALNLGASKWRFLLTVKAPYLFPALLSSFLVAFAVSLDNFYLSYFLTATGSGLSTLPVYLYGLQSKSALTPEMNVVAGIMIFFSLLVMAVILFLNRHLDKTNLKDQL